MKKRYAISLLALLAVSSTPSGAQQARWSWARRDGSISYPVNPAYPRQVVAAGNGRVLWGTIQNQRQLTSTMLGDYQVRELDTAGAQIASVTISGRISLLQARTDAAGNWYLLGTLYDSMQVGSGSYVSRNPAGTGPDRFLLRLHAGTLAQDWLTMIGGDNRCSTEGFMIDGSGIYLSVDSSLSSQISRYDPGTGARTTVARQRTRSYVTGIARDASGGTYVLGNCVLAGMVDFNGTKAAPPHTLSYPWYIVRYNASGAHDWHYFLNDNSCNPRCLNQAPDGVYLSGDLFDSTSIGTHHFNQSSDPDFMIARVDSSGALTWGHQRPVSATTQGGVSFAGTGKAVAADSTLILAPETTGPAIWGTGGIATDNRTMNGTIVGYGGSDGSAIWAKAVASDFSNVQHIATDGAAAYITGVASDLNSIRFDNVSVSTTAVPGKYVPYLAKLDIRQPALKAEETSLAYGLYVWPNPATTTINIYSSDRSPLRIVDATGRLLWRGEPDSQGQLEIGVADWPRGMYVIQQAAFGSGGIFKIVLR